MPNAASSVGRLKNSRWSMPIGRWSACAAEASGVGQFCVREPRYAITDDESAAEEPMKAKTHESLVSDQFGSQAAAYLKSVVHARGADLDQIEKLVHGQSGARVLDLGCGGGHVSYRVAPHVAE